MEIVFDAIGLEIRNKKAFSNLADDVEKNGEASQLTRKSGVLHGRCWRMGEGLEVWTVLYESRDGKIVKADCRPGFRARYNQRINPWILTEFDEKGEALIHGFIENSETEILFELQNLTEVSAKNFQNYVLNIGLCGLAFQAEVIENGEKFWKCVTEDTDNSEVLENNWNLCGEVLAFNALRNPFSGSDLYWLYLDLGEFSLEVLVNQKSLQAENLFVGALVKADVWLQGHLISEPQSYFGYEGVDYFCRTVDFWQRFKREN